MEYHNFRLPVLCEIEAATKSGETMVLQTHGMAALPSDKKAIRTMMEAQIKAEWQSIQDDPAQLELWAELNSVKRQRRREKAAAQPIADAAEGGRDEGWTGIWGPANRRTTSWTLSMCNQRWRI